MIEKVSFFVYLTKLTLHHYRNIENLTFYPGQGLNIITGANAQGKTNLIEAVYLCCTGRSHRTSRDSELIQWGQEYAAVECNVKQRDGMHQVGIQLQAGGRKGLRINGLPAHKLGELMGHVNAVIFSPEDLQLVKGGPAIRRRFIDMELSQTDRVYFYDLQNYLKALQQRNALLKSIALNGSLEDTLDIWDEQLALHGAKVSLKRREFAQVLQTTADEKHRLLTGGSALQIAFSGCTQKETLEGAQDELMAKLKKSRQADIRQCATSVGPHREDLTFQVDSYELKNYGSQGQNRSVALSLKLAELEIMRRATGEMPMLILDDVLSELDEQRRLGLLHAVGEAQTFITCVRIEAELAALQLPRQVFKMQEGSLNPLR